MKYYCKIINYVEMYNEPINSNYKYKNKSSIFLIYKRGIIGKYKSILLYQKDNRSSLANPAIISGMDRSLLRKYIIELIKDELIKNGDDDELIKLNYRSIKLKDIHTEFLYLQNA